MSDSETNTLHPQSCGCAACTGYNPDDRIILDANVDGTGGTLGQYDKPVYTLDQVIANMNRTSYVGTGIPGPQWNYGEDFMGQNKSGDPSIITFGFQTAESVAEAVWKPKVMMLGSPLLFWPMKSSP